MVTDNRCNRSPPHAYAFHLVNFFYGRSILTIARTTGFGPERQPDLTSTVVSKGSYSHTGEKVRAYMSVRHSRPACQFRHIIQEEEFCYAGPFSEEEHF